MEKSDIQQLLELRLVADDIARGYLFEQTLRELIPWDFRPPLSLRAKGEQIDAFFEWNSWHFILEAKAKRMPIQSASHDWEDFELKVRKRNGSCIGLFVTLFKVAPGVIQAAEALNRQGLPTIILDGDCWDNLAKEWIPITHLLRYMVLHAKANHKAIPPGLNLVRRWCYDHEHLSTKIQSICRSLSAAFLRRHALPRHSQIYIPRNIDSVLIELTTHLRPSALSDERRKKIRKRRISKTKEIEYMADRQIPYQICVLRDASGSGKTTLSVQFAFYKGPFFGISRAAYENDIDETFIALDQIGPQKGLNSIIELNKPFICFIDSLDEAINIPGKKSEIIGLIRTLDNLNREARALNLIAYPLLLIFTIREDYWREWESIFEGARALHYRNHFSLFNNTEFSEALNRYSDAYQFVFLSYPNEKAVKALSLPFNLSVFSEANEFSELVTFSEIFDEKVLQLYFERKRENVVRRRVPGFTSEAFIRIASEFAMYALRLKSRNLKRKDISYILSNIFPHLYSESDHVLLSFLSEGILVRDPHNPSDFCFKHSRYMEYLIAQYIVRAFEEGHGSVEDMVGEVFESGVVSMYRVHDFVRFICKHEYPLLFEAIMDIYSKSEQYMVGKLLRLRVEISHGKSPPKHDISLIRKSLNTSASQVAWHAFFVIAAKIAPVQESFIFEAFEAAWKANAENPERWKIIDRLTSRGLLLRGNVIERILESRFEREWECLLGAVLSSKKLRKEWQTEFYDLDTRVNEALSKRSSIEWMHIHKLWNILIEGAEYIPGSV